MIGKTNSTVSIEPLYADQFNNMTSFTLDYSNDYQGKDIVIVIPPKATSIRRAMLRYTTNRQFGELTVYNLSENLTQFSELMGDAQFTKIKLMFNTSGITNWQNAFTAQTINYYVQEIIGEVDLTNATNVTNIFNRNYGLSEMRFKENSIKLSIGFDSQPSLSDNTITSIINGLVDMTGEESSPTITFHKSVKAKLTTEQIAAITAKNWTLA